MGPVRIGNYLIWTLAPKRDLSPIRVLFIPGLFDTLQERRRNDNRPGVDPGRRIR